MNKQIAYFENAPEIITEFMSVIDNSKLDVWYDWDQNGENFTIKIYSVSENPDNDRLIIHDYYKSTITKVLYRSLIESDLKGKDNLIFKWMLYREANKYDNNSFSVDAEYNSIHNAKINGLTKAKEILKQTDVYVTDYWKFVALKQLEELKKNSNVLYKRLFE